ncbi:radical SAM protein [Yoonia sp. 2307UL14-13]|uniref:radical SAM protein n=1 Tax=Yoonia sp. 2307UL14-13 TaxID=3126506 RepID=UPI0030A80354
MLDIGNVEDILTSQLPTALQSGKTGCQDMAKLLARNSDLPQDNLDALLFEAVAQVNDTLFPAISQIEMVYTEGCNLACTYCFEKDMLGHRRMPEEVAKKAVDLLFRYAKNEQELHIAHFGGEPLVNFRAVKMTTEYAEEKARETGKKVCFNMTTNGTLINDHIAQYCADHNIMVMVSLDGLQEANDRFRIDKKGRGTFDRAFAGLMKLAGYQDWVGVKMTVMPGNCDKLLDDVKFLHDAGVNQFTIGYATGVDWPEDERRAYVTNLEKLHHWYMAHRDGPLLVTEFEEEDPGPSYFGCQAGRSSVSITVDGEVSPCSKVLAMDKTHLLARLGDVTHGLYELKNRVDLVGCGKLKTACGAQGIDDSYQGGCFATNYEANGDLYHPNATDHDFSLRLRNSCAGCAAAG